MSGRAPATARQSGTGAATAQFRSTESDYVSAQWAIIKRHPLKIVAAFRYVVSVFVIVALAAIANAKWHFLFLLLLACLGFVVFGLLVQRWRWHRSFRKAPFSGQDVLAEVDRQTIKLRSPAFEAAYPWEEFADAYETPRGFVFEGTDSTFVFMPKAGIEESQAAELRNLMAANAKRRPSSSRAR